MLNLANMVDAEAISCCFRRGELSDKVHCCLEEYWQIKSFSPNVLPQTVEKVTVTLSITN